MEVDGQNAWNAAVAGILDNAEHLERSHETLWISLQYERYNHARRMEDMATALLRALLFRAERDGMGGSLLARVCAQFSCYGALISSAIAHSERPADVAQSVLDILMHFFRDPPVDAPAPWTPEVFCAALSNLLCHGVVHPDWLLAWRANIATDVAASSFLARCSPLFADLAARRHRFYFAAQSSVASGAFFGSM